MKKSIILAGTLIACGQAFAGGFAEQTRKLREQEEQRGMEQERQIQEFKQNIQEGINEFGEEAKAAYKATGYAIGVRVINTASSWAIEVKDPVSFGKWIQLPKAKPLSDENVCYVVARKDFKVRVLDENNMPIPESEVTIGRANNDVFAINVRSVSAGRRTPTISFEAYKADQARAQYKNLDL